MCLPIGCSQVSSTVQEGKITKAVIKTEVEGRVITIALDRTIDGDAWICSREGKKTVRRMSGNGVSTRHSTCDEFSK